MAEPYVSLGVNVVVAPTVGEARRLAAPMALSMLRLRSGRPGPLPSNDEAAAYTFTPGEKATVQGFTGSQVVGDVATVTSQLDDLLEATAAQELIVTTNLYEYADRVRSYELLAELGGLGGAPHRSKATAATA